MSTPWPDPDPAADLHRRLCADDPVAPADLAAAFLGPLYEHLRRTHPGVDDHLALTAAEDAVLAVIRRPAVYDPARGDLEAFLRMAARGDLANALARERRHAARRDDRDCVELPADGGNTFAEDDLPSFDDPGLGAVIAGLTETERRVFELMRAGERSTAASAKALGVAHLPADEQARAVKRVKDRIIARLKRARGEP